MVTLLSRTSSRLRTAGLVLGGVALGVGVAVGASAFGNDGPDAPAAFGRSALPEGSAPLLDRTRLAEVEGARTRAESPAAAVEAFLSAEQDADHETSFAYLADAVRVEYGSPAAWAADHPDVLPPVTGFSVEDPAAGSATVVTLTEYRSSLDTVTGLVPARARTSWATVEEEGGWAVDVSATTQEVLLPPEQDAVAAVQAWAKDRQACTPAPPDAPDVRGRVELVEQLCGADGAPEAGAPGPLAQLDARDLQNSFGADVLGWARTVPLDGPVPLRAVVAPLDDRWVVVSVLAANGA